MRRAQSVLALVVVLAGAGLAAQSPSGRAHPLSGRVFAPVMGTAGMAWLDRPERLTEEEPDRALDALALTRGDVVADVGAGSGYMSERLARRVGPSGLVYANDVQPAMLAALTARMTKAKLTNVRPVLGTFTDPGLPAGALDLILLVDVYHEFSAPQLMLRAMHTALKPAGRLVLLEYRQEDPEIPILPAHKMSVADARLEVEAEGFRLARIDERLPRQHILIFTVR